MSRAELSAMSRSVARWRVVVALALVILGGLVALATAGAIARNQRFNPVFMSAVLLLGTLLIIVVLFVLGRNLIKLYLGHRSGEPGSRYRTRVTTLVAGLTLLPSLLLFFIASGILQAAVGQWFQPEAERVLTGGRELLELYQAEEEVRATRVARLVSSQISEERMLQRRAGKALRRLIESKRLEHDLAGIRVYDGKADLIGEQYAEDRADAMRSIELPSKVVDQILHGERDVVRHAPEKTGELVWAMAVPVVDREEVIGALVVVSVLGIHPSNTLAGLHDDWLEYQQARDNQERVKQGFVLVLGFFTLLLLLSAVWVGSALSKMMTVPIQALAEATRAVSEGRLDVRVEGAAPDEVGELVRSFNRMMEELRIGKLNVESSTHELQRSNIELEGRRKYTETILESIPTGVISLDKDGRITNLNQAAIQMFGLEERVVVGAHYGDLFGAKEFLELHFLIDKVLGIRDLRFTRNLHIRLNRRTVDLAVSFTALRDAEERHIGLIVVLEDLSNLIKAQKVAAWREVARRIAHEIKNPLTPIQLSAQRIWKKFRQNDPDLGRVIADCTATITHEVDGLKTLVNEFSRFARMPPVSPVPTQLDKLIHNVMVLYDGVHPRVEIEHFVEPDIPTLSLDPEQIKRVLINLVDNAVHCQADGGRIIVRVGYDARAQSARLEVSDLGPGIPPDDREKLFIPYFSTKSGGTGLGLAIVHRIVSDHGGRIRVEDNVPHGARFIIDLPA